MLDKVQDYSLVRNMNETNEFFDPKKDLGGRPPKWKVVEELEKLINEYFSSCKQEEYTITGLCLYLKTNKQTLLNYQAKKKFSHLITMAKLRVENAYELSLRKHGRSGDIFALKNFGWRDNIEITGDDKKELFPTKIIINGVKSTDPGEVDPGIPDK